MTKASHSVNDAPVIVVTGAAGGIGQAIVRRLAEEGARILAVDMVAEQHFGLELIDNSRVETLSVDLTELGAPDQVVARALERFGRLDGVVNNAGVGSPKPLHLTEDADYDRFVDVCLRAVFRLSRSAVRHFLGTGEGVIVQIASAFGVLGNPGSSAYAAAKAGVIGLTRQMAAEYGPLGIRVNAIAPGVIATPMTQDRIDNSVRFKDLMINTTPWPRIGRPDDVAHSVSFLCSRRSEFINGHVLVIDGGWSATNHIPVNRS